MVPIDQTVYYNNDTVNQRCAAQSILHTIHVASRLLTNPNQVALLLNLCLNHTFTNHAYAIDAST